MGETNFAQYSSAFPRFFPSLGFHPMGENAKSRESPWLLVETAIFTPLSVDSGKKHVYDELSSLTSAVSGRRPDVHFHVQQKPQAGGGHEHGHVSLSLVSSTTTPSNEPPAPQEPRKMENGQCPAKSLSDRAGQCTNSSGRMA
jgi:hypothetical protein